MPRSWIRLPGCSARGAIAELAQRTAEKFRRLLDLLTGRKVYPLRHATRMALMLQQLVLLKCFQLTWATYSSNCSGWPFPGPLCGMALLLAYLQFSGGPSDQLTAVGTTLVDHSACCSCRPARNDRDLCGAFWPAKASRSCRPGDLDLAACWPAVSCARRPPSSVAA